MSVLVWLVAAFHQLDDARLFVRSDRFPVFHSLPSIAFGATFAIVAAFALTATSVEQPATRAALVCKRGFRLSGHRERWRGSNAGE
jgi:hypothetical protein